jgi:N-acyl-phosphatidylethanolamine-hydrolysing phospholipase D
VTSIGYKNTGKFAIAILLAGLVVMLLTPMNSESDNSTKQDLTGMTLWDIARNKVHHGPERFINPFSSWDFSQRSFGDLLMWKFFSDNPLKPYYKDEQVIPVNIDWAQIKNHHSLSVTFITHSTVLIRDNNSSILVDPVLFGMFWPIRDFSPLVFKAEDMPKVDAVLITHGHYDHLDLKSLKLFNSHARFICPLGYAPLLKENGSQDIKELDWLDSTQVGNFEITFLPCNHWTMRNPFIGPNTALWGSYLIKTSSGRTIYISGDTAYFDRFKEIGDRYTIDLAIFNLGAYEPRWFMKNSHINPEEVVRAFQELGAKKLLVVHWGTFRLGDEPVYFPPIDIKREMKKAGLLDRLFEVQHGQTMFMDQALGL